MIEYYLTSFGQGGQPDSPVNCEVQYRDTQDPKIQGTYPSEPLDGEKLGPAYTNQDLADALTEQLGVPVQVMKGLFKVKVAPEQPAAEGTPTGGGMVPA